MAEEVTIVRFLEKLSEDGYDLEIQAQSNSVRVTIISDNERFQVSRFIPADFTPSELAFIFWDISSSIKKLERKYGR